MGKPLTRFRLRRKGSQFWFDVLLCDNREKMYKAYKQNGGMEKAGFGAIFCPREVYQDGERARRIGTLFLDREHAGTRVVSHELVHVALTQYRATHQDRADFGDVITDTEEELAYDYCELFTAITCKLHALGLWR